MQFRLLGLLEVVNGGGTVSIGPGKESALLASLLLHANQPVSVDRLADQLWGDPPPGNAAKTVQVYVSRLRKRLGPERLVTTAGGYVLRAELGEVDVARFERLAVEGRHALEGGSAHEAARLLSEALALWRGPALADFRFETFAQSEIRRLEEFRVNATADWNEARLALGETAELLPELERLARESPLHERLCGQLMLCLYRCGRQAEALDIFQVARSTLVEELGIEPGRQLRELQQAILRQDQKLELAAPIVQSPSAGTSVLVGRESELAELDAGLDHAFAGRGRLFLLVGEPGIGKSRLAEEVIAHASARGVRVLVGRCWEAGGAPAYWPWVQLLRMYVEQAERELLRSQLGAGAVDLAQIVPELRREFPDLAEPPSLDSDTARFRLFDATAQFLRNASQNRPLLLVLDDLHAADAPSLLLLQFVARELGSARMLLLGACRDTDPPAGAPLTAMLAEVAREPSTRRLALARLSRRDVAEYVELTASGIASPELAAALHEQTEGNPFFVAETVRLLALEALRPEASEARIVIPQSVRDVIGRRLSGLSNECNEVLVVASVLGREFAPAAVARITVAAEDELLETLDEAMAARVVSDVPGLPGRLRFAHVLIRDTLYEGLTTARRVRLHRQAFGALEVLYGDEPGPHLAELAYHAIAGSDFDKGRTYAQRAGDRALELLAFEEAARLYQTSLEALELARPSDPIGRCGLLLSLGHAQVRAGDSAVAKATFLEAAAVARSLELPEALAQAALGYGGRFVWGRAGDDERLVPLLREALVLAAGRNAPLRARLLGRLAAALGDDPDPEERARLSDEAVELARRCGDAPTLAYALVARLAALWSPETVHERLAIATELVELAERIGDKEREVEGHGLRFNALLELGEVQAADDELAARGQLTNEMRQPAQLWVQLVLESSRSLFRGDFQAANETINRAFDLRGARGDASRASLELQRFVLCREQGGLADVESSLTGSADAFPTRPVLRCALTNLFAELDRVDEARLSLAALAADDFAGLGRDGDWLVSACFLAETSGFAGAHSSAASLYPLLLPYAERNVNGEGEVSTGAVSRYLGLLAASLTKSDEAVHHFEHALELNARMGARPWLAHTQHDYGEMLLARGQPGDRQRAKELLETALATYRELGMNPHAARLAKVAARSATPHSLPPR